MVALAIVESVKCIQYNVELCKPSEEENSEKEEISEKRKFFYIVVVGEGEMGQKGGKVLGEAQGDAI